MMAQHGLRDMAVNLAPINWTLAAEYSKQIDEPWYACQAFAWCARFAPQPDADRLIDKAFHWAELGKDVNVAIRINQGEHEQPRPFFWPLR